jgi:hypothetical protein
VVAALAEGLTRSLCWSLTTPKTPSSDERGFRYTDDRGVRHRYTTTGNQNGWQPLMYSTRRWCPDIIQFIGGSCLISRAALGGNIPVAQKQWVTHQSWCWSEENKVWLSARSSASVTSMRNMRLSNHG